MKKRLMAYSLCMVMVLTSLAGCGSSTAPEETTGAGSSAAPAQNETTAARSGGEETAAYKDEIHIAYKIEPATLDTMKVADAPPRVISYGNIYEALVTLDSQFRVKEELAESYTVSDDSKEYTFVLRKGVKFHNGAEMTADDVVASMNRWIENYANAQTMVGDARFEKVDDYTVKISMAEPARFLAELIATQSQGSVIMPEAVLADLDPQTGMVKEYIGTGPYKFGEWKEGVHIRLDRFDDYVPYGTKGEADGWWGYKEAPTKTVYYDIVPDVATRTAGIQTGEYDVATEMSSDDFMMFESDGTLSTFKELNGEWVIVYNKEAGLTADVNIRQAVNAIANPNEILTSAHGLSDFFRIEKSFMPEETANWYTEAGGENAHRIDAELAKSYLEKAGYNGEPFRILAASNDVNLSNAAVALKAELEAIGMNVEMVTPDWTSYSSYRSDPTKYEVFFASLIPVSVPTLQIFLSSSWAGFTNDQKIFDMTAEINQSASLDEAQEKWTGLQTYLWEESLPATKLGSVFIYHVYSENVEGFSSFCSAPIITNLKVRE